MSQNLASAAVVIGALGFKFLSRCYIYWCINTNILTGKNQLSKFCTGGVEVTPRNKHCIVSPLFRLHNEFTQLFD